MPTPAKNDWTRFTIQDKAKSQAAIRRMWGEGA